MTTNNADNSNLSNERENEKKIDEMRQLLSLIYRSAPNYEEFTRKSDILVSFIKDKRSKYPNDYDKVMLWHLVAGSSVPPVADKLDFPGEDSIEVLLKKLAES